MNPMRERIEKTVCFLALLYTTEALMPLFFPPPGFVSTVVGISVQVVLYGAIAVFSLLRWRAIVAKAKSTAFVLLLVLLALLSAVWSQYPSMTTRRGLLLGCSTLLGMFFAERFSIREQFRLLVSLFGSLQILSIAFALLLPQYGLDHARHIGVWQGVFYQKNQLGAMMALSFVIFLYAKGSISAKWRLAGLFGSLGVLLMSRSVTALAVLLVAICCIPAVRIFRTRFTFAIPVVMLSVLLFSVTAAYLYSQKASLFAVMHRGENLTGRTLIWSAVLPEIAQSPVLGYGYSAFWLGTNGASGAVAATINFCPKHAHNGFLDIWLELGGVGFALFVASYISQWTRALPGLRHPGSSFDEWAAIFLLMIFFYNLAESELFRENKIVWVLYTANAMNLASQRALALWRSREEVYGASLRSCVPE